MLKVVSKKISILLVLVMLSVLLLPVGNAFAAKESFTIAGSTSVQPVSEVLSQEYMKKNPHVRIYVQGGGSSKGIKAAHVGAAEIGSASRNLREREKAYGLKEFKIAVDGIAIVTHKDNKAVDSLSVEQVRKIFAGEIKNWKELGGSDAPINVVSREEGSGTRGAFEDMVMEYRDASGEEKEAELRKDAAIQNSNGAVRATVAGDKNAIGYLSLAHLDASVRTIKIDGVEPTAKNIIDGKYKIARPFLYLTKGEPKGEVKKYIDWVLGPEGQKIIAEKGLVTVGTTQASEVIFKIGSASYTKDGKSVKMDTKAVIKDGRTFVPLRYLLNALGVSDENIEYKDGVITVNAGGKKIVLTVGSKAMRVDGKTEFMDVAPFVDENDRTLLPAKYVAEELGYSVDWNEATKEVTITK
ncbi:phosphate ABC transporter substrate-binding protein PstS family protein [Peptococcaceae bacterium]|nr:phosphate ABC transporter substrate-binding protein PstS family protein [Peptococcaceae bacterium]